MLVLNCSKSALMWGIMKTSGFTFKIAVNVSVALFSSILSLNRRAWRAAEFFLLVISCASVSGY